MKIFMFLFVVKKPTFFIFTVTNFGSNFIKQLYYIITNIYQHLSCLSWHYKLQQLFSLTTCHSNPKLISILQHPFSPLLQATTLYINIYFMLENCVLQEEDSSSSFLPYTIFLVLLTLLIYQKVHSKKRLSAIKHRPTSEIDEQKVIVALQLQGIFVEMSDRKKIGFSKVAVQPQGIYVLIQKVKQILGLGIFYRIKSSVKTIKTQIQTLHENPKVSLFLYTTLEIKVAEFILERLCLAHFFKMENRRSCNDSYSEQFKHPTELDFNTKRVIILTASKTDHLEEYSKYFLVVKGRQLGSMFKILNKTINRNSDIDEFHGELGQLKAEIESDVENTGNL